MTERAALLDALLADPAKAAGIPADERQRLAALAAALAVALLATPGPNGGRPAGEDEMLTAEQAARRIGMSRRWLYRQARAGALPFARRVSAHGVRFSARGIDRWLVAKKGA